LHKSGLLLSTSAIFFRLISRPTSNFAVPKYSAHNNNDHNNQHNYDDNQHCAADHDNDDQHGHHDIIDDDNNHDRATLHWVMYVAMARRIAEMDQDLWR
jgi:hypothetical protein